MMLTCVCKSDVWFRITSIDKPCCFVEWSLLWCDVLAKVPPSWQLKIFCSRLFLDPQENLNLILARHVPHKSYTRKVCQQQVRGIDFVLACLCWQTWYRFASPHPPLSASHMLDNPGCCFGVKSGTWHFISYIWRTKYYSANFVIDI